MVPPEVRYAQDRVQEFASTLGTKDVAQNLTDAKDQPRNEESKKFQRLAGNKFCRSLYEHKSMSERMKVVSDHSRTTAQWHGCHEWSATALTSRRSLGGSSLTNSL